ncbi:MAG: AAA family ATPase [Nitrososphaera sp.]|jgi:cell division control protein 6
MDSNDFQKILGDVQNQENMFLDKSMLDGNSSPPSIIGREKETREFIQYITGYKKNFIVPLVSIYGRSGSGKSTLVKFICENLKNEISFCFVNLRKSKTIFGAVNVILGELGMPDIKSAHGINQAIDKIEESIQKKLEIEQKKLCLLVLDEFDTIFFDKRNRPSDFIYKLLMLQENLKKKGLFVCLVCISNNVLSDYEIDDRIRSRIGTSEIFFRPYSKEEIFEILKARADAAFIKGSFDNNVLEYCAAQSSLGHGDARRAVDLLRVAAETASLKGSPKILTEHVDMASEKLQKDRLEDIMSTASYHIKLVCFALARLSYLTDKQQHATSTIYSQYQKLVGDTVKQLTYRRVSELLTDLENTGVVKAHTASMGRHGYGTQFKLAYNPEIIGELCFADAWNEIAKRKKEHDTYLKERSSYGTMTTVDGLTVKYNKNNYASLFLFEQEDIKWTKYVGVE